MLEKSRKWYLLLSAVSILWRFPVLIASYLGARLNYGSPCVLSLLHVSYQLSTSIFLTPIHVIRNDKYCFHFNNFSTGLFGRWNIQLNIVLRCLNWPHVPVGTIYNIHAFQVKSRRTFLSCICVYNCRASNWLGTDIYLLIYSLSFLLLRKHDLAWTY